MSDEQWLWLFVNQRIDVDEKLERMCPECREEVTSGHKCIRCGKDIGVTESFVNPNFDMEKYEMLKSESYTHVENLYKDYDEDEDSDEDDYEEEDYENDIVEEV